MAKNGKHAEPVTLTANITKPPGRHEFDGIKAEDDWVIVEQVSVREKTLESGVILPEAMRLVVWKAISIGPNYKGGCKVGDRVLFMNPQPPVTVEGRTFAFLKPLHLVATLEMPEDAPMVVLASSLVASSKEPS